MMHLIKFLPFRQKLLLVLAIVVGLFIWICSATSCLPYDTINDFIFAYCIGLPFSLLLFPTIIDLNDNRVFIVWLILSGILLCMSITATHSYKFLIHRSPKFDKTSGINSLISDFSISSLKSLFIFLVVYWILNQISKKLTGNFIVNTYWQYTWTNEDAKRKMTSLDVLCNIILFITILWSVLF